MADAQGGATLISRLLLLPLDLREQIYRHVLFDDLDPTPIDTGVRKRLLYRVKPYNVSAARPNHCALTSRPAALLQVCRQVHDEAAKALYNGLLVDLDFSFEQDRAPRFLDAIGSENRALLRYIRLRCYFVDFVLPYCIWTDMMQTIRRDCATLEKLTLVYPQTALHQPSGGVPVLQQEPWLCSTLELAHRLNVDMEREQGLLLFNPRGLRSRFAVVPKPAKQQPDSAELPLSTFAPFLRLPVPVQRLIIHHAIIPSDALIHPTLCPSLCPESATILPLMLTSRTLHTLTEQVCYSDAIFASCLSHHRRAFMDFMRARTDAQLALVQRWFCLGLDQFGQYRGFFKFMRAKTTAVNMNVLMMNRMYRHPCIEAAGDWTGWRGEAG